MAVSRPHIISCFARDLDALPFWRAAEPCWKLGAVILCACPQGHQREQKKIKGCSHNGMLRPTLQDQSDPAPLIFDCKPEAHRRVHCIWLVDPLDIMRRSLGILRTFPASARQNQKSFRSALPGSRHWPTSWSDAPDLVTGRMTRLTTPSDLQSEHYTLQLLLVSTIAQSLPDNGGPAPAPSIYTNPKTLIENLCEFFFALSMLHDSDQR